MPKMGDARILRFGAALILVSLGFAASFQTECIDGSIFTIFPDLSPNFEAAVEKCEQLDPALDSVLAAIRNADQLNAVVSLIQESTTRKTFFIGLRDFSGAGGKNTNRFSFVSSNQTGLEDFIHVERAEFPWGKFQPDDQNQNQDCGVIFDNFGDGLALDDAFCQFAQAVVCSSNCPPPTASPTTNPTASPSASPTLNPTKFPTFSPTTSPTVLESPSIVTLKAMIGLAWLITASTLFCSVDLLREKRSKIK